jgi:hypothetical protein
MMTDRKRVKQELEGVQGVEEEDDDERKERRGYE